MCSYLFLPDHFAATDLVRGTTPTLQKLSISNKCYQKQNMRWKSCFDYKYLDDNIP